LIKNPEKYPMPRFIEKLLPASGYFSDIDNYQLE